MAAAAAELIGGNVLELTLWAGQKKLCPKRMTELSSAGILDPALRAMHGSCPSRYQSRS